ncbi:hypothetical protein GCM10009765_50060 [Fodinicola feengrottensis]|uniref:HTH merR-type domain-containing protein n=1 Tax=Fodinicola feengrottensis TaxID=435914 RepID=A0ABN2HXC4_9ACTN
MGELAAASGLTVRALHHYDEIGLLPASARTGAGHRRYTADDVRRLYRVRALRHLGLSLEEISAVLHKTPDAAGWRSLLTAQLDQLAAEADRTARLVTHVRGLLAELDGPEVPTTRSFLSTLEAMSMFETYFDQNQRDRLAGHRSELGEPAIESARTEFLNLADELGRHRRAGTPVDDPAVRALVRRWTELAARFTGGDQRIQAAAGRMWDDNRAELSERAGWSPAEGEALVSYIRAVRSACG